MIRYLSPSFSLSKKKEEEKWLVNSDAPSLFTFMIIPHDHDVDKEDDIRGYKDDLVD